MNRLPLRHWGMFALVSAGLVRGVVACGDDDVAAGPVDAGGGSDSTINNADTGGGTDAGAPLECEVAITGGGPGGVHTAYMLTNPPSGTTVTGLTSGSGVCLFEKIDRLGGRFRDIQLGPNPEDVYGTGGYRLYT